MLVEGLERYVALRPEVLFEVQVDPGRRIRLEVGVAALSSNDSAKRQVRGVIEVVRHVRHPWPDVLLRCREADHEVAREPERQVQARQNLPVFAAPRALD